MSQAPAPPEFPGRGVSRREALLAAVLAALMVVFVIETRWFRAQQPERTPSPPTPLFTARLEEDPEPGAAPGMPAGATLNADRLAPDASFTVLLFASSCASCARRPLLDWQRWQRRRRDVRLLVLTPDTPANREEWEQASGLTLPVAFDEDRRLKEAYNAFWSPRAYLLDREGRLLWIQKDRSIEPWQELARALREGRRRR